MFFLIVRKHECKSDGLGSRNRRIKGDWLHLIKNKVSVFLRGFNTSLGKFYARSIDRHNGRLHDGSITGSVHENRSAFLLPMDLIHSNCDCFRFLCVF